MSEQKPHPENVDDDATQDVDETADAADVEAPEEPEVPLNRAARRGRPQETVQPGHVGPQVERTRTGRGGPRAYTKRRSG